MGLLAMASFGFGNVAGYGQVVYSNISFTNGPAVAENIPGGDPNLAVNSTVQFLNVTTLGSAPIRAVVTYTGVTGNAEVDYITSTDILPVDNTGGSGLESSPADNSLHIRLRGAGGTGGGTASFTLSFFNQTTGLPAPLPYTAVTVYDLDDNNLRADQATFLGVTRLNVTANTSLNLAGTAPGNVTLTGTIENNNQSNPDAAFTVYYDTPQSVISFNLTLSGPFTTQGRSFYIQGLDAIPEPGTVGLLGLGSLAILAAWFRPRRG